MTEFQTILLQTQHMQSIAGQLQHLRISKASLSTKKLNAKLCMLTIAATTGIFITKNWTRVLKAQGKRLLLILIEVETADRSGIFRAQTMIAIMQTKCIKVLP